MAERYPNKRMRFRGAGGRFSKPRAANFGIGGVCSQCNSLLIRVYDGEENQRLPDPAKFRYRCFTCEPDRPTQAPAVEFVDQTLAGEIEP